MNEPREQAEPEPSRARTRVPWGMIAYCLVGIPLPVVPFTKAAACLLRAERALRREAALLLAIPILIWIGGVLLYGAGLDGARYVVGLLVPQLLAALVLSLAGLLAPRLLQRLH